MWFTLADRTILHLICVWNAFCSDVRGRSHMQQICVLFPATLCCSTWSRCHSFHYAQCVCDVKDKAMISAVRGSCFLSHCPPPTPHLWNVSKTSESSQEWDRREEERSSSRVMTADPRAVCVYLFMCSCFCRESFKWVVYKQIQSSFIFLRFIFHSKPVWLTRWTFLKNTMDIIMDSSHLMKVNGDWCC